jgi:DEAD/DEAH box helicase domain-containing protein
VDHAASHQSVHEGAVYTHQGETFVVHELDLDAAVALVEATPVDYTTFARDISNIHIVGEERTREITPSLRIHFGDVQVTSQTVSFARRHFTGENLGTVLLDLPVRSLKTKAVWWTFPLIDTNVEDATIAGAIHGAEHASIGMLPLFASCDRWDIGGVSTPMHPDTGEITIFIYDGLPGGAGIAEFGFDNAVAWMKATCEAVTACPCDFGCPSCIQSPKCGNGNEPLSKSGAIKILTLLSSQLEPKP